MADFVPDDVRLGLTRENGGDPLRWGICGGTIINERRTYTNGYGLGFRGLGCVVKVRIFDCNIEPLYAAASLS